MKLAIKNVIDYHDAFYYFILYKCLQSLVFQKFAISLFEFWFKDRTKKARDPLTFDVYYYI